MGRPKLPDQGTASSGLLLPRTRRRRLPLIDMLISLISTAAILVGLAGTLPQIATMLRSRSSHGQSPLGWGLGISVNAMMAYVNLIGFHAAMLALGNVTGAALCTVALGCVRRLGGQGAAPSPEPMFAGLPQTAFSELPTAELVAVRKHLATEEGRRIELRRRRLVAEILAEQEASKRDHDRVHAARARVHGQVVELADGARVHGHGPVVELADGARVHGQGPVVEQTAESRRSLRRLRRLPWLVREFV
jgi:hypothetical protein